MLNINPMEYIVPYKEKKDRYQNVGHRAWVSEYDHTQKIMLPDLNESNYVYQYIGWFSLYAHKIQIETIAGDLLHILHKDLLRHSCKKSVRSRTVGIRKAIEIFVYNILYSLKNNKLGVFANCDRNKWKGCKVINSEKVNAYCSLDHYLECVKYFEEMGYIIYVRGVKATAWTRSISYHANFGRFLFTDKLKELVNKYAPKFKLIKFKWYFEYTQVEDFCSSTLENTDENKEIINYSSELCKKYNHMIRKHDVYKCDKNDIRIMNIDTDLRRKFYRDDVKNVGRFHMLGGSIQTWHKTDRPSICLDGEHTIEMDIKGTHLSILYTLKGLPMPKDPYKIPDQRRYFQCYRNTDTETIKKETRSFIKKSLLIMINAKNYDEAHEAICKGFKKDYNKPLPEQAYASIHKVNVKRLMQAIADFHSQISEAFYSDAGIKLMGYESDVMGKVLEWCVETDTPMLQVYDSFICKCSDQTSVAYAIFRAWKSVFGDNYNLTLTY